MLEEALRDDKGRNPSETALAMLNFLQYDLPPGGAAADARLCNGLFGPLCERVFGPIDEVSYRHAQGSGWLSSPTRWARASASSSGAAAAASSSTSMHRHGIGLSSPAPTAPGAPRSTPSSSSSSTSSGSHWEMDPVVLLLATANRPPSSNSPSTSTSSPSPTSRGRREPALPTLVEAISGESENRPSAGFAFPFLALPQVTQDAYMQVLEATVLGNGMQPTAVGPGRPSTHDPSSSVLTDNDVRLFGTLLNRPPRDQPGVLRWRHVRAQREAAAAQQQQQRQHSPQQQFRTSSPMNLYQGGFPSRSFHPQNAPTAPAAAARILSPGGPFGGGVGGGTAAPNTAAAKRDESKAATLILSMLEYYLLLFVRFPTALAPPTTSTSTSSSAGRSASYSAGVVQPICTPFGEMVYNYLFARYVGYFLPYATAEDENGARCIVLGGSNSAASELFLRLCVSLWLEAPTRPVPTAAAVTHLVDQRGGMTTGPRQEDHPSASGGESRSFVYSLDRSFDLVQTTQAYTPPASHVKTCLRKLVVHVLSDPSLRTAILKRAASAPAGAAGPETTNADETLANHALWALQTPLYNYVRVALRNASIHANDGAFFGTLDLWLLYLEPWNVIRAKSINPGARHQPVRFNLTVPRYSDASRFERNWEPFVAANLHMYLTPLAIFLRRSRELDFSPRKFESSLKVVKRVLRVFSPALLRSLDEAPRRYPQLFQQHAERLGTFAPPLASEATVKASSLLPSCQPDMHSLLEEVHMQHLKKIRDLDVIDRLGAWFEGIFGMGVIQGEEKELQDLVARARGVVGFPSTYQVFPKGVQAATAERETTAAGDDAKAFAMRTSDGRLTDRGRQLIVEGRAKCNPADVSFVGDRMYGSVRPHELEWLVLVLVHLSEVLNGKLGWSATTMVRINLRFLADYRNLLATVLTLYIVCKFTL